jgi:HIV Tat-specific factor 1
LCGWRDISAPLGILQVDDDLLQQQQEAYKIQGVDENEQVTAQQLRKKRKQQAGGDEVSAASDMALQSILVATVTD